MVCVVGRCHKDSSHHWWECSGRMCSIELVRTCEALGVGPHATRPIGKIPSHFSLDKRLHSHELTLGLVLDSWNSNKANVMYTHTFSTYVALRVALQQIRWMNKRWLRCSCKVSQTVLSRPTFPTGIWYPWRGNQGCGKDFFSVEQAYVTLSSYRSTIRQESGSPEPMNFCYAESKGSLVNNHKKLQRCNRCQKRGHV